MQPRRPRAEHAKQVAVPDLGQMPCHEVHAGLGDMLLWPPCDRPGLQRVPLLTLRQLAAWQWLACPAPAATWRCCLLARSPGALNLPAEKVPCLPLPDGATCNPDTAAAVAQACSRSRPLPDPSLEQAITCTLGTPCACEQTTACTTHKVAHQSCNPLQGNTLLPVLQNGTSIVSGWSDGRIRAFGPQSGKLLYTIHDAHHGAVTAIAGTADSARILSGGEEGAVRVWRVSKESRQMEASMKVGLPGLSAKEWWW